VYVSTQASISVDDVPSWAYLCDSVRYLVSKVRFSIDFENQNYDVRDEKNAISADHQNNGNLFIVDILVVLLMLFLMMR
jgi:hypothetical protein